MIKKNSKWSFLWLMKLKNVLILLVVCVFVIGCNKTSNKITWYINCNCDFKKSAVFFNYIDSSYYTASADFIDLKKALKVDYDTLYLISAGFESDISDIIEFKYTGGDFTVEAEDKNLLLLVKDNQVVYKDIIKEVQGRVCFFDYFFAEDESSFYLLKHSSSIYKVEREKNDLLYDYYLYNVNDNVSISDIDK